MTLTPEKLAELRAVAEARVKDLERLLTKCATELECEINHRYPPKIRNHPGMKRRFDRDMSTVLEARQALKVLEIEKLMKKGEV